MVASCLAGAVLSYQTHSFALNPLLRTGEGEVARRCELLRATGNSTPWLPFGVTLVGPAWSDAYLWKIAADMHKQSGLGCGPSGHGVPPYRRNERQS